VCAVLDSIGFYKHRNWSKSAGIVNAETTFARVMSDAIDEVAAQSGGAIVVISSPASRSYNLLHVEPVIPPTPANAPVTKKRRKPKN
jgi:hypothetical protein